MKKNRKILLSALLILTGGYLLLCLLLYFQQENLIFFPDKLPQDYTFRFDEAFEEHYIPTADGTVLHGLLFKADTTLAPTKGLVFFLHGNAGGLHSWGTLADTYTQLQYDVFMPDYRGYGKSRGKIENQEQFYNDAQAAYDYIKSRYREENIVVTGFSIGTAAAAMLAARNKPQKLLLLAPYYSLVDIMQQRFPFVPSFLLKYKFRTYAFLEATSCPVYIFHGTADEVIPYNSSLKLEKHLKSGDRLFTLKGQDHNGIHDNEKFQTILSHLLLSDTSQQAFPTPAPLPAK